MEIARDVSLDTILTGILIIVAIWTILAQARLTRFATASEALRDIAEEFHYSAKWRRRRLEAAKYFLESHSPDTGDEPAAIDDLSEFFDLIAYLHNAKIISSEMFWVYFFYWFSHWWQFLEPYVTQYEIDGGGVIYFENSRKLYRRMCRYGRKYKRLPEPEFYFSEKRKNEFLREEIQVCRDAFE